MIQSQPMKLVIRKLLLFFLIGVILLTACSQPEPTAEATQEVVSESEPTPYPDSFQVGVAPYIPDDLVALVGGLPMIEIVDGAGKAKISLDVSSGEADIYWVYALTAPFSYIGSGVSSTALQAFWSGVESVSFPADMLFLDGSTSAIFEKLWGAPDPQQVLIVSTNSLLAKTWDAENAFALLPFEQLEPTWQVLPVDDISPIHKSYDAKAYPLVIPFSFIGDQSTLVGLNFRLVESQIAAGSLSNRRADQLTTVVMTGVTALVRGTAYIMEASGNTYPAIDIGDILREADILHINNEIPFAETCPNPFSNPYNDANMIFCSKPEYIQLLESIGTDVVELAGDHFWNWGEEAMYYTIDMYDEHGWQYYGGGRNYEDGVEPALFTHNGNKIAFIGCSAKPPGYTTASKTSPGAVTCDMTLMASKVQQAVEDGYQPIFTFQHTEYYSYNVSDALRKDFVIAADAGAVIVQGSQAHQPHALEFYKRAIMHYGLGNLFFDQYNESFAQRQAFIDRHVFYNGRHVSTELITIMFIDNARPRLMSEAERADLLTNVFTASGW